MGGYALCEARTREEAVALAREFMELHRLHWPGDGEAEVRPLEGDARGLRAETGAAGGADQAGSTT